MNTINTTRTHRSTALAMAFSVTALLFGGIDGLAHAPESGSVLAGASVSEPAPSDNAVATTTATAPDAAVTSLRPRV